MHLLLPGTAVVYYGDEIAMPNVVVNDKKDPLAKMGKVSNRIWLFSFLLRFVAKQ